MPGADGRVQRFQRYIRKKDLKSETMTKQVGEDGIESISYGDRDYHVGGTDWRVR